MFSGLSHQLPSSNQSFVDAARQVTIHPYEKHRLQRRNLRRIAHAAGEQATHGGNMGLESPAIVTACLGNIVEQPDCDAIVNSANTSLRAGSGVCGAIHKAAGPELARYAVQFAPLGLAQAVATPGFNLPNRIVIHCRGPNFHFEPNPASNLGMCLGNVLELAEKEGVRRIAIPAISMGVYGFPLDEATHILAAKATAYARNARQLHEIRFVVTSGDILAKFVDAINLLQTS